MPSDLILSMRADEFNILDEFRSNLQADGSIKVPDGYQGYVIHGPYWDMSAGLYVVQPQFRNIEETNSALGFGDLEICDKGIVLASTPLAEGAILTAQLAVIRGLEIRIKANGNPFVLESVLLVHLPTNRLTGSTVSTEQVSRLSQSEAFLKQLAAASDYAPRESMPPPRATVDFDVLWEALNSGASPSIISRVIGSGETNADQVASFEKWVFQKSQVLVVNAWEPHLLENAASLEAIGVDLAALRLAGSDLHALNSRHARDHGESEAADLIGSFYDGPGSEKTLPDWFDELERVQGGFSKLAALTGAAFVTCPFTGETLRSEHCFPIDSPNQKQVFLFYRFHSIKTFYVIIGGFSGSKMFIYVPNANVILRLHSPLFEWGQPRTMVAQFMRLMLENASKVSSYLQNETIPAAICGTMDNVGHFFWNEASGLVKYYRMGLLRDISWGIAYRSAYIDPYLLLPEDILPNRRTYLSGSELFCAAMDEALFIVKPVAAHIDDEFAESVRSLSRKKATEEQISRLKEAKSADCVLWIALRNHNKVWVQQVEGLLSVIVNLIDRYNNLSVYVDGTPDCKSHLEKIKGYLPEGVRIYAGIDVSIMETLLWAFEIDIYVATIGSGLTFTTWLAAKPGVAHSETHHLGQMSFWGKVRPGAPSPLTPLREDIDDVDARGYCDYRIDPARIVNLVNQLPLPPRTCAAPTTGSDI